MANYKRVSMYSGKGRTIEQNNKDYQLPKYKKGDKFYKDDFEYKILGTKECIADYNTGRKGICYVVKDNKCKGEYSVPCWYLEKNNEKFGYRKK